MWFIFWQYADGFLFTALYKLKHDFPINTLFPSWWVLIIIKWCIVILIDVRQLLTIAMHSLMHGNELREDIQDIYSSCNDNHFQMKLVILWKHLFLAKNATIAFMAK